MQMQMAMQKEQASIQGIQAKAESDKGWAVERYSRVKENQALAEERRAQAIKDLESVEYNQHRDEEQSLLNFIKAAKEIRNLDIEHISQILQISRELNAEREGLRA